jgi:hypothetical protein
MAFISSAESSFYAYQNNIITVAVGNNVSLTVTSSDLTTTGTININGSTEVNLTSGSITVNGETLNYSYEVVSPKVIWQRIPDTNRILLQDVSGVGTYNLAVSATNSTYIKNPLFIGAQVIVENNVNGVWTQVAIFPFNGNGIIDNSINTLYRSRIVLPGLSYNQTGNQFTVPSFTSVYTNFIQETTSSLPLKNVNYQDPVTGAVDLTVENLYNFQTSLIDPDNLYKYNLTSSAASILPSGLTYSNGVLSGATLAVTALTPITITFTGTKNSFVNGILTTSITPFVKTISILFESVSLSSTVTQQQTSYSVIVNDTTVIANPAFVGREGVEYQLYDVTTASWLPWFIIAPLGTYTDGSQCTGNYNYRRRIVMRQIAHCHGTSPIIFQSDWQTDTFSILEYVPSISFPPPPCCYQANQVVTITPSSLNLNSNVCSTAAPSGMNTLIYTLTKYNPSTQVWDQIQPVTTLNAVGLTPLTASFTFTPSSYGTFKLNSVYTNCNVSVTDLQTFSVCNSVEVTRVKDSCNQWQLFNYDLVNPQPYTVRNTATNAIDGSGTLQPGTNFIYTILKDGIYTIQVGGNVYFTAYSTCQADNCYTQLIRATLCNPDLACKNCLTQPDIQTIQRNNEVIMLYQTFMRQAESYYRLPVRYSQIDITNSLSIFSQQNQVYSQLLSVCQPCMNQLALTATSGGCGCNK